MLPLGVEPRAGRALVPCRTPRHALRVLPPSTLPPQTHRPPLRGGVGHRLHQGDAGKTSVAQHAWLVPCHSTFPALPDSPTPNQALLASLLRITPSRTATSPQEMLDFCSEHNIVCDIEKIGVDYVNSAMVGAVKRGGVVVKGWAATERCDASSFWRFSSCLPAASVPPLLQDRLERGDVKYRFVIDVQGTLVA